MSDAPVTTEILPPRPAPLEVRAAAGQPRFEERLAVPFIQKSLSEETRESYRRGIRDFFLQAGGLHPTQVTPEHVLRYRDRLVRDGRRPATIAQRLSVIRSFFAYLQAAGVVTLNPASTKLVPPPALPSSQAGRALTPKEVRHLLAAPDRSKPEGTRDYALLLVMLRLSLRLSEVCSLRRSSITSSQGRWILKCKVKGGREEVWPLPVDIKEAIDDYLRLDSGRRRTLHSDGPDAPLFEPLQEKPATASLYYDFSGAIDNIYTTLIVRLSLSGGFGRVRMRQDGAEFERSGLGVCEVRKVSRGGGVAHLDLIFSNEISEETRSLFTLFVEDHLRREGVTITEGLSLTCNECGKYNFAEWVLRERLREGQKEVVCPLCEARSPIIEGADSQRESNPEPVRRLIALKTDTNTNTKRAVAEMRNTIGESSHTVRVPDKDRFINILHLSDIHMSSDSDPFRMIQPLARDLEDKKDGLGLDKLDYLVISGDLTNRAAPEEFEKACQF